MTVGYGDKVPVTVQGKLLTIAWMFAGTYCVGMFGAAVTSTFVNSQNLGYLPPADKLLQIQKATDLDGYRLGTSSLIAKHFLEQVGAYIVLAIMTLAVAATLELHCACV